MRARLDQGRRPRTASCVPQAAVSRDPKGDATACVVDADGQGSSPRDSRVAQTVGDKWLVTGGLKAGDRVIVEGLQKVQPGAPVKRRPCSTPSG